MLLLNEKWIEINYHTVFFHALYKQYSSTIGWLSRCDDLFTNSKWKLQMISFIDSYDLFTEIFVVLTLSTKNNYTI